jgi:hypothetical protein
VGVLMLKCSITGREFSTDVHIDEDSFRKLPGTGAKACCPYCGCEARWVNSIQPSQRKHVSGVLMPDCNTSAKIL